MEKAWKDIKIMMGGKEVAVNMAYYTKLVTRNGPILVIGRLGGEPEQSGFAHGTYSTISEALRVCALDGLFADGLVCIYNLDKREYVQHDRLPTVEESAAIEGIINEYINASSV